ncbi:MAG: antitoxin Xre/MbcA/ParS toxin-binding domain-containing protein [Roseiarcus sp.]
MPYILPYKADKGTDMAKSSVAPRRRALRAASPTKLVDDYGLTKKQLAETIGLAPEALYKRDRLGAAKTQSRLREMNEILTRVAGWAGGPAQAMAWYRAEPIPAFGGRTAEALVKSGQAGPLRDYLDSIALGGFA